MYSFNVQRYLFRKENWGGLICDRNNGKYLKIQKSGVNAIEKALKLGILNSKEKKFLATLCQKGIFIEVNSTAPKIPYNNTLDNHPQLRTLRLPLEILYYVTNKCNNSCSFCYLPDSQRTRDFSQKVASKICQQLRIYPVPILALLGGEPFLIKSLPDLIHEFLLTTSSRISISTNGLLIRRDILEPIALAPFGSIGLNVSFHAIQPTNQTYFKISTREIERKKEFLEILASMRIPFSITTVIHRENVKQLDEICKWLIKTFSKTTMQDWTIAYMHSIGRSCFSGLPRLTLTESIRIAKHISQQFEQLSGSRKPFDLCFNIPFFYVSLNAPSPDGSLEQALIGCSAYYSKIEIAPNGDVYPCSYFFDKPNYCMGNVLASDLPLIWNNNKFYSTYKPGMGCPQKCRFSTWCVGCLGAKESGDRYGTCSEIRRISCTN